MNYNLLNDLEIYNELIKQGTYVKTSDYLKLQPSKVKRCMIRLEEYLGFDVIYNDKGKIKPTKKGLILYEKTSILIDNINKITGNILTEEFCCHTGYIKIAINYNFVHLFDSTIFKFQHDFKNISIILNVFKYEYDISVIDYDFVINGSIIGGSNIIAKEIIQKDNNIYIIYNYRLVFNTKYYSFLKYIING